MTGQLKRCWRFLKYIVFAGKNQACSSKSKPKQSAAIVQRNPLSAHMRKVVNQQPENLIALHINKNLSTIAFKSVQYFYTFPTSIELVFPKIY